MKVFIAVILASLASILPGCASSPSALYPDFPSYKGKMSSGALLADCVIIDDMIGDTNKIDVVTSKSFGGMLLTYLANGMIEKGYPVGNTLLTSVGLLVDPHRLYKLVRSLRAEDADLEDLPLGLPPFYLDPNFQSDSAYTNLWSTYNALVHAAPKEEGSRTIIPSASEVGARAESGTLLIVMLGGFEASESKSSNEESASNASTVGRIGIRHVSQVTVALYIVDAASGELLWSDQRVSQGGTIHKEKILRLADKILDELP